jgi:hypothetical protein
MWTVNNKSNPQMNPLFNFINNSSYETTKSTNPKKPITPIQFGFNFYFNNIKSSSPFTPIHSSKEQNVIKFNNYNQKLPIYLLFQSSLEKSGYKISAEQYCEYNNEIFNDNNNINNYNEDLNYYNFPTNANYSINNNKIINNIYPTITKVTNVKILSDNNNNNNPNKNIAFEKIDYIKLENKKENINNSIQNVNINENDSKKEENKSIIINKESKENITDKKSKIIFECSESKTNAGNCLAKKFIKKKRFRKNNEQINHLSKFYKEHKIWSKNEIREMSKNIGLKENKIYKWLWDQKNKEYNKSTKFVINKNSIN